MGCGVSSHAVAKAAHDTAASSVSPEPRCDNVEVKYDSGKSSRDEFDLESQDVRSDDGTVSVGAPFIRPVRHERVQAIMKNDQYVQLAARLATEGAAKRLTTLPPVGESRLRLSTCSGCTEGTLGTASMSSVASSSANWVACTQTIIVLDWDDTLFPTTWLRQRGWFRGWVADKGHHPVELAPEDQACLTRLDESAQAFLEATARLGQVCCVTLARRPWQARTMKAFFPRLAETWQRLDVQVRYAQEEKVAEACSRTAMVGVHSDPESDMEALLREEGKFVRLKMKAMRRFLQQFYKDHSWKNVVSIGDGPAERQALKEIGFQHVNPTSTKSGEQKAFRIKTVQMVMDPCVEQLLGELQVLTAWLPSLVSLDNDFDVDFNTSEEGMLNMQEQIGDLLEASGLSI